MIRSPNIKRQKGIRAVKKDIQGEDRFRERSIAHNKLFDFYLTIQNKNPNKIKRLIKNWDFYSNLLLNEKRLQYMNLQLLSKVLLFLDYNYVITENILKYEVLKSDIKFYLNDYSKLNIIESGIIMDFYRYLRFMLEKLSINDLDYQEEDLKNF